MFPSIDDQVSVDVSEGVTFQFLVPLSVTSLIVTSNVSEAVMWELADETPKGFDPATETDQRRMMITRPHMPILMSVRYGESLAGYSVRQPPQPLTPGRYTLTILAEQGKGIVLFEVPPAR